ncbi:hypothetical protein K458DRAFT_167232 [Lentithecium fluviatile CBS 122367]|uniref:HhH-GPD domain-containing protein n=1 Tax=Lentithecium fluviatile CBS 122367 TaxID=1168545 RepID=A0A6G1JBR3_9PLEO|nr:hypothetical protein K458DRAFT_167232 [Lentithecium fluviatile CBS 122367]
MTFKSPYFPVQACRPLQQDISPSAPQLFERACASLNRASEILAVAAADMSSASIDMRTAAITVKSRYKKRRKLHIKVSPYFPMPVVAVPAPNGDAPPPEQKARKKITSTSQVGPQMSPHFTLPSSRRTENVDIPIPPDASQPIDRYFRSPTPPGLSFDLQTPLFGLIQERICGDLFALVVQAIPWNKTRGLAARPILWVLLRKYPTPEVLAGATLPDVEDIIRKLGLQQRRAQRLVDMAKAWIALPPTPERRYGRRHYPRKCSNLAVKDGELLGPDDVREGWEIAHLPGVGEYALDSFRIFGRDRLRGISEGSLVEPEWKRLVPKDKELGPYVRWKWAQEEWDYDVATGISRRM